MLYMIIVKASTYSESQAHPEAGLREKMDEYNEFIEEAGIKVMAKGLHPTRHAYRMTYDSNHKPSELIQGPFEKVEDQIAGFFIIDVSSEEEALKWFKKVPDPIGYGHGQVELRKIY